MIGIMKISPHPQWNDLCAQDTTLKKIPELLRVSAQAIEAVSGETLYRSGTRPRSMLYVLSGELRLLRRSHEGVEIVLQRASSGFIAEASLESPKYHCDIMSASDSRLLVFPITEFKAALDGDAYFRASWSSLLAKEVRKLRAQCERLSLKSARDRILHYITAEGVDGQVRLPVSRKAWAAELGLTHEALYRSLAQLEREQVLVLNGNSIGLQRS
jgi:CRP/FNR family transcriptional regulator, dissimilatory nitrate respiration regulator